MSTLESSAAPSKEPLPSQEEIDQLRDRLLAEIAARYPVTETQLAHAGAVKVRVLPHSEFIQLRIDRIDLDVLDEKAVGNSTDLLDNGQFKNSLSQTMRDALAGTREQLESKLRKYFEKNGGFYFPSLEDNAAVIYLSASSPYPLAHTLRHELLHAASHCADTASLDDAGFGFAAMKGKSFLNEAITEGLNTAITSGAKTWSDVLQYVLDNKNVYYVKFVASFVFSMSELEKIEGEPFSLERIAADYFDEHTGPEMKRALLQTKVKRSYLNHPEHPMLSSLRKFLIDLSLISRERV